MGLLDYNTKKTNLLVRDEQSQRYLDEGRAIAQEKLAGVLYPEIYMQDIADDDYIEMGRQRIKEKEPGLLKGAALAVARGVPALGKLTGHAIKTLDPEGGIDVVDRFGQKIIDVSEKLEGTDIMRPRMPVDEGFVGRGIRGGLESTVPSFAPMVAGTGAGAAIGSVVPGVGTAIGGIIGGVAATLGIHGLGVYGQEKERYLQQGIDEETAHKAAVQQGIVEGGIETVSNIAGMLIFGWGKLASQPLKQTAKELLKTPVKTFAKNLTENALLNEVPTEMIQGALGAKIDERIGLLPEGAWQEAAVEAIIPALTMSVIFGLGAQGATSLQRNSIKKQLNSENPKERVKAAEYIAKNIDDKELRQAWIDTVTPLINEGLPIDINADFTQTTPDEINQVKADIKSGLISEGIKSGDLTSEMMAPAIERIATQDPALAKQLADMFVVKETDLSENERRFEEDPLDAENNAEFLDKYIKKSALSAEKTKVALEEVGVEIPDFKTTGEAYAFGEKATPEQVKELQRLVKVQDTKFNELKKAGKLQEAMDEAIKHQFYNEALQKVEGTEQYKKFKPEPKEVPKTGTEKEKVEVTPEKKEAWEMTPKEWTQESLQPTIEKMKIGETKVLPDKRIIVKSSQDLTYGETYISRSPVKTKMLDPSEIDQLPDKIKNFVERYEAGEKDLPPIYVSELMVNPKTGETFREIRDGHHRYYMAEEVGLEELPAMERVSGLYPEEHEAIVRNALKKGENVPENVLAEYPDLKPQPEGAKSQPPKIEKPKPKLPRTEDLEGEGIGEPTSEQSISQAYEKLSKGEWNTRVRISDIKAETGLDQNTLSKTLKEMQTDNQAVLYPFDMPSEITRADKESAVEVGGEPSHIVFMKAEAIPEAKPKPKEVPKTGTETEKVEVTKEDIEAFIKPLHHKYYLEGQNKGIAVEKLNAYGALQINKLVGSKLRANVDMDAVKQYLKEHPTKVEVTKKAGVEVTAEKKEAWQMGENEYVQSRLEDLKGKIKLTGQARNLYLIEWQDKFTVTHQRSVEKAIQEGKLPKPKKEKVETKTTPEGKEISVDLTKKEEAAVTPKQQKEYLLAEIDKAIEEAPVVEVETFTLSEYPAWGSKEAKAEWQKEKGVFLEQIEERNKRYGMVTIHVPDDGIFTIVNAKQTLTEFKKKAKKFPATFPKAKITVPGVIRKTPLKENIGEIKTAKGAKYFTDGSLIIKGEPPAKAKYSKANLPQKRIEEFLATKTQPAELKYHAFQDMDMGEGVSRSPIPSIITGHPHEESYGGYVVFQAKDGTLYSYNQLKHNTLTKRFPKAKYGISKDEDGLLIAYDGKEAVAALMPVRIEGGLMEGMAIKQGFIKGKLEKPTDVKGPSGVRDEKAFATKEPYEKDLIAYHNTTAAELLEALESGGLAMPSIAITRKDIPYEKYGPITLIGRKETIDPKGDRANRVFDSDIYSPRVPGKGWNVNQKEADKVYDRFESVMDEVGIYKYNFEEAMGKGKGEFIDHADSSNALKVAFLREQNIPIQIPKRKVPFLFSFSDTQALQEYLKSIPYSINSVGFQSKEHKELSQAVERGITEYAEDIETTKEEVESTVNLLKENHFSEEGFLNFNITGQLNSDQQTLKKKPTEVDKYKLEDRLKGKFTKKLSEQYLEWINKIAGPVYGEPFIKLGRKKVPYTLGNIVKAMKREGLKGEEKTMVFGPAKARAKAAKQISSIKAMHGLKDRLVTEEKVQEAIKDQEKVQDELTKELIDHYKHKDWRGNVDVWAALDDAMKATGTFLSGQVRTISRMQDILKRHDFENVSVQLARKAVNFSKVLMDTPTQYFELKSQKAVGFDEFEGAVIPTNASLKLKRALKEAGLTIKTYKEYDTESRQKAVSFFHKKKGVLFSTTTKPQETITRKDLRKIFKRMKHIRTGQDSDGNLWFKATGRPKVTIFEVSRISGYKPLSGTQLFDVKTLLSEKPADTASTSAKVFSDFFRADSFFDHLNNLIQVPFDSTIGKIPSNLVLGKSTSAQSLRKSVSADIQFLSDVLSSPAFSKKGFSGLDVKTQRMVLFRMRNAVKKFKIADSIVENIPIDMVDDFSWEKFSFQESLKNPSVFKQTLSVLLGENVSVVESSSSIIRAFALAVTKNLTGLTGLDLAKRSGERLATIPAGSFKAGAPSDTRAKIGTVTPTSFSRFAADDASSIFHKEKGTALHGKSQELFEGYIETSGGRIPVGSYLRNVIELKTSGAGFTADTSTFFHELCHFVEKNGIISANDIAALNRVIAKIKGISESAVTEEHRAYYVGDNISAWETQKNPRIRRILRKLKDFMNAIYDFAAQAGWVKGRERTAENVLSDIGSGAILKSKQAESLMLTDTEAGKQFATKPTKDYGDMLKRYQVKHTTPLVDETVDKTKIKHFDNLEKTSSQPDWIKDKFGREEKTLKEKIGDNVGAFRKNWQTRLLDRLHPIKALGETAYMLHRLETGAQATMAMFMRHGKLKWEGKALTIDTQKQGFMPWLDSLGDDAQKLFYWMAAKRAEVLETEGREKWLDTDTRKKIFDWVGEKPKSAKSWRILNNQFQDFNKSVLNLAQQSGLINPIKRAAWEQEFYVPFYRIFEDAVAREEFLKGPLMGKKHISAQIKRLLGAEMKIGDPLENVIRNWSHLIHESVRNMARAEAYDYAQKKKIKSSMIGEGDKLMPLIETVKASELNIYRSDKEKRMVYVTKKGDDNILSFQKNGRRIYFKVNDIEMFNALGDVNHRQFNGFLVRACGQAKRWLTYGATFGPAFKVANMLRDSLHTAIISKSFIPFIDSGKGIVKALREDADYVKFMASGAGFGSSYIRAENPQALAEYINRIVKKEGGGSVQRILDTPKKMLDFWEKLGAASENAARVQLYTKRIAEGETHLKAAFEGRDLMDFTMRGDSQVVQYLIRTVPFMNARAQGLYKLGRAAKQDPKSFMIKGSILTIATLALWAINRDKDEWKELEDWDKRTYYHFWIGSKHYRIPKPFETGAIFSTVFEGMAEVMSGDEEFGYFVDVMKDTFLDTFAMNPLPQAVRPLIEQWSNKSFFTGRPIEGQSLQRLKPGERKTAWTSETMQLAGKLGVSPKRAEEIIRGYFSTFGMFLLGISDIFSYHLADFPVTPTKEINDYPLLGRFIKERVPARHTKYQTKFYEMFREIDQLVATVNNHRRLGNYKEATALATKERKNFSKRKGLLKVRKELTEINARLRRTMASRVLTADQKRTKIDGLVERKNKITRNIYERYIE